MRKLLIVLFVGFLVFDLLLALKIFYPQMAPKQGLRSVSVRSEMTGQQAHLTNESALRKKLDVLDFWSKQRVNRYKLVIDKVTVEHLVFVVTDKPQHFGQRIDKDVFQYSYGQKYNNDTKTMEVYLQLNKNYQSQVSFEKRLSALAMFALYDLVYTYPKKDPGKYDSQLRLFLKDSPVIFRSGII